ncbi:ABC transporter ATP-binding protein [Paenibacillus apiarius]|uniref:ABC transporter ATP-binding protein/permease n=1 Tax=Paenibacillus apiarius TaxID=46240 RepID=A0ABT4DZL4_9BACL|nr:ABC transporter ATP-binding protein [Paenibacillus apiarius]MCY9513124.1 ABC transporter ATP-binding protein/permease [Paenibacillus apiarius]MCY9521518.1 ABC transporter ATP-binding protein/permease [Paenibacillus apiarius]MCY9551672.1 ABC transporter ATP-binding protein/permease [Paenibacillus apiarius]MCY9560540.1 ABC transporter ATP-binding protein/permease [Paenibacillus apiarius]MCY9685210.1 ABC transporter ATP-binding protein/permease [Paenibacillus apiarius]
MFNTIRFITGRSEGLLSRATLYTVLEMIANAAPAGLLFAVLASLVQGQASPEQILWWTLILIGLFAIQALFSSLGQIEAQSNGASIMKDVRLRLGEHLRKLPMGFFARRDQGDISHTLLANVDQVEMILTHLFNQVMGSIILPAVSAAFLLVVDWRLAIAVLVSVPLALPLLYWSQSLMNRRSKQRQEAAAAVHARLLEYVQTIRLIKANNQTGQRFSRLDNAMARLRDDSIRVEAMTSPVVMLFSIVLELGFVFLLLAGCYLLEGGVLDTASFLIFLVVSMKFYQPLRSAGAALTQMRYMASAGERIRGIFAEAPLAEPERPQLPVSFEIEFCDVRFRYGEKEVLQGIDFRVPERNLVALVGPSGAGKSTIAGLVSRFWDVAGGAVRIGGVDVRDMRSEELLAMVSTVQQQPYLFNETIASNIRMGKPGASHEEVVEAAKAAYCHDFIEQLPQGYDTVAGEGGAALSGGEKQRISIARAILKNAPIVILDEATASLDPENEAYLQQAIAKLAYDKTVLVIAHRLKTIRGADRILVVDRGRTAEAGKHEELLAKGGLYSGMWQEQQRLGGWRIKGGRIS